MLNVVIFGAPGSGKGTQSELIIKEYGLDHISTGDVLRGEMKAETELGKIAKDYIEKGQLVPDELIVDMLANVLDSKKPAKGVIFDGFPRTIGDLREGMTLPGIVTNITAFGAFVDIGIKQDGLVHISQMADRYVASPAEVVHLGQQVEVRVTGIDTARGRISLSMRK